MRKKLLKSMKLLLVMALLGVGANAWGQTTILYERGTTLETAWSTDNISDFILTTTNKHSSAGTRGYEYAEGYGAKLTSERCQHDAVKTISPTANSLLNVEAEIWLLNGITANNKKFANGDGSYFRFGNVWILENYGDKKHAYSLSQMPIGSTGSYSTFAIDGYSYTSTDADTNPSLIIKIEIDMSSNKLNYLKVYKSTDTENTVLNITNQTLSDPNYTTIGFGMFGESYCSGVSYEILKSVKVTQTIQDVETADYTIKYMYDGNELKDAVIRNEAVGNPINLISSDREAIWNNNVKYIYDGDGSETNGKTVSADGSTVVEVPFRMGNIYTHTITSNLSTTVSSGSAYEGENLTITWSKYIKVGNVWYEADNNTFRKTINAISSTGSTIVNYSEADISYFYEFDGGYTTRADNESNGSAKAGSATVTVPEDGIYIITANCYGSSSNRSASIKVGETTIVPGTTISIYAGGTNLISSPIELNEGDVITVSTDDSASGIDYVLLKKYPDNVSVTVSSASYSTFVSSYSLDFSETATKAYKVKVNTKGKATLTKVGEVPAGTPVLLYKDGGATEDIPVIASAAAIEEVTNDLVAGTATTATDGVATIDGSYTNMILNNVDNKIGFYYANGKTVAENRAYLHILTSLAPDAEGPGARMTMVFADEETAINSLTPDPSPKGEGSIYTLSGQRVSKPMKGLYIIDGKKVLVNDKR